MTYSKVSIPSDIKALIKEAAENRQVTQSAIVAQSVSAFLNEGKKLHLSDRGKGTNSISISLTKTEVDMLEQQSKLNGLSRSKFIASLIRDSANLPLANDDVIISFNRIIKQLRSLGNNINQIARFLNRANFEEREKIIVDEGLLISVQNNIQETKKTVTMQVKKLKRF